MAIIKNLFQSLSPTRKKQVLFFASLSLFGAGFFTAKVPFHEELAIVSSLFIIFFALPSFLALFQWQGNKRASLVLAALSLYALALETTAVYTGYPYGDFVYTEKIGGKLFDFVPWTVPLAWIPLLLGTYYLARKTLSNSAAVITASAGLLVMTDLLLDPGAVALNFWIWEKGGWFYQVPWTNFAGWFLTGWVGTALFHSLVKEGEEERKKPPEELALSLFLILVFWTSVCLWKSLYLSVISGLVLMGITLYQWNE